MLMINFALADMVGVGSSVPISIALGRKDEEAAYNFFSCAVLLIIGASIFTGSLMFLFAPQIIRAMGVEEQIVQLAVTYLRISAAMRPLANLVFAMDNYLRISGFVRGSMLLNILMSGLQLYLLVLLVVVCELGLVGSAFSISTGFSVCALIALIPFVRGKSVLKFRKPKYSAQMLKRIVVCGSPHF